MGEFQIAACAIRDLLVVVTTAGFPPVYSGAFWILAGFYGVVSIFFDDEVRRGTPGIEYLHTLRQQRLRDRGV
jgi:hypothetical protein